MDSPEMKPLIPAELVGKSDVLFGNLQEIYTFHNDTFLKDLQNCISTTELVALCFTHRVSHLKVPDIWSTLGQIKRQLWVVPYRKMNSTSCTATTAKTVPSRNS